MTTIWLERAIAFVKLTRDSQLIALGVVVAFHTPPSLREIGLYGPWSVAWALMTLVGAALAGVGTLAGSVLVEGIGCIAVGVGFAVWAVGALQQPNVSSTTVTVALLLGAGVSGQFLRPLITLLLDDLREPPAGPSA